MSKTAAWRRAAVTALLGTAAGMAAGADAGRAAPPPQPIDWATLQPAAAAEDNPFTALSDAQAEMLRELVLSRWMEARGRPADDAVVQRRAELTRALRAQGLDADALLTHREVLIAQRRAAAEATVDAIDGRPVQLAGYLLPAELQDGRVTEFLLVPVIGACSHTPPPPPNQAVRVRPAAPRAPTVFYQPVSVAGTLQRRLQDKSVFVVDGALTVRSAYAMDGADVTSLVPRPAPDRDAAPRPP